MMFSGKVAAVDSGYIYINGKIVGKVAVVRTTYLNGKVIRWEKQIDVFEALTEDPENYRKKLEEKTLRLTEADLKLFDGYSEEFIGVMKSSQKIINGENIFEYMNKRLNPGEKMEFCGILFYKWNTFVYGLTGNIREEYFAILPRRLGYPLELMEADRISRIRKTFYLSRFPRLFRQNFVLWR